MTYGWAILIIAVVLGALFSLGVFSSSSFLGTACIPQSGFLCSNPVATSANIIVTVGQATGTTWYSPSSGSITFCFVPTGTSITGASCPSSGSSAVNSTAASNLYSGQTVRVFFPYPSGVSNTIGSGVSGTIWAIYSTSSGGTALISEIGTLTAKVS